MSHLCHWPGCRKRVPPALWGCRAHWRRVPVELRERVRETYVVGQEDTHNPSAEYIGAALDVQRWITGHRGEA